MVGALDFQPESRWFEPGLCCHVVALESPPRCIIGYRRHNAGGGGGGGATFAMDWYPIQGGVVILSVASCYRNRVKLRQF